MGTEYYAYAVAGARGGLKEINGTRQVQRVAQVRDATTGRSKDEPIFSYDGTPLMETRRVDLVEFAGKLFRSAYRERATVFEGRPVEEEDLDEYIKGLGLEIFESGWEGHHDESIIGIRLAQDCGENGVPLTLSEIIDGLTKADALLARVGLGGAALWTLCHISY